MIAATSEMKGKRYVYCMYKLKPNFSSINETHGVVESDPTTSPIQFKFKIISFTKEIS